MFQIATQSKNKSKTNQTPSLGLIRQRLFSISPEETTFAKRGFHPCAPQLQQHLERVGATFLQGYHAVMENDQPEIFIPKLNSVENEWRGFAFEGAAMALTILDTLTPWKRNRVQNFLAGAGDAHTYMVHVGVGWVPARLGQGIDSTLAKLDPLLGWLAVDGYGFHEGYFKWPRYVREQAIPKHLSGYALRVFDQGLGRSLWFVEGADVTRLRETIATFPVTRQADLWGGVGLGCSYAAGVEPEVIQALRTAGAAFLPLLSQGAAFAAKARARAGNPTAQTDMACEIFCGMSAEAAAAITDLALKDLPTNEAQPAELPAYEVWRQRIQAHFTHGKKA